MDIDRVRESVEDMVTDWLRDYGIPRDKSHGQLVNRTVMAIYAMYQSGRFHEEPPPSPQQSLACGD